MAIQWTSPKDVMTWKSSYTGYIVDECKVWPYVYSDK